MASRRGNQRPNAGAGRVPPHNLNAEESLLGAILLSREVVGQVVGLGLRIDHFYKPSHQHIFAAIDDLMQADEPVDVVTVADLLRRKGMLDEIGGAQALLELQNATPAISNANRYARIVRDTAILRQLISVAGEITEAAYLEPDDPATAILRASELLNNLDPVAAEVLSTLMIADMAALFAGGLQLEQPTLGTRTDGGCLLYPGKTHTFQAEPSAGKSWIALAIVCEVLAVGGSAAYIDCEDSPPGITGRLVTLGASPAAVIDRFFYVEIPGRFGPAERLHLTREVERMNFDLVVIDGVAKALQREGLSEDKAEDVIKWFELLPHPLAKTGAAVLMLDHVAKNKEEQGRWARGTGAKLAEITGATYQVKVRQSWSKTRSGRVDLVCAKDRPGNYAVGEIAATVKFEPYGAGERLILKIEPPAEVAPTDSWKPTVLMGKVWNVINDSTGNLTATAARTLVHSAKPALVKEAIARLLAEGYIAEGGKPKTLRVVKPYDGAPMNQAPAWREPPPELFHEDDGPSAEDLDEIMRQRIDHDPNFDLF